MPTPAGFLARLLGRPLALLALIWIAIVVVGGLFAGQISSYDPLDQDLLAIKQLPSAEHLLGTDALGRDVLSRLLHGTTPSLVGVVQALTVVSLIGVLLGLSAGYFGGWWDRLVVQYVSLLQAIPVIVVLLSVLSIFGQSMSAAMVTLGILGSAGVSRVVRSVVLGVREELYIAAARISGPWRCAYHPDAHTAAHFWPGGRSTRPLRVHHGCYPDRHKLPRPRCSTTCAELGRHGV